MIISIEAEKASAKAEYVFMTKVLKKLERAYLKVRKAIYDKAKANSIVGGKRAFILKSGKRVLPLFTLIQYELNV